MRPRHCDCAPNLSLTEAGAGIDRTVTIEAPGEFRLVFEAADNWGLAQWYDLAGDPDAKTDLLTTEIGITPDVSAPALFQQVYGGTVLEDAKLYQRAAKAYFPDTPRNFAIIENSPQRTVVEATSHPVGSAVGMMLGITVTLRYDIRPDGLILIRSTTRSSQSEALRMYLCGMIGMCDPTNTEFKISPDRTGWLRSSATQRPYSYREKLEPFVYAYWDPTTAAPYRDWTRASIMLAFLGGDLLPSRLYHHSWKGFKRWGYACEKIVIHAGATITQNYAVALGSTASKHRPAYDNAAACRTVLERVK